MEVIGSPASPAVSAASLTVNVGASASFTASRTIGTNNPITWWTAQTGGTEIDPDGTSTIDSFARTTANGANGLAAGAFNVANNKVASITGTTNQIVVAGTTTIPALSLPQSIHTGASVQFASFGVGTAASGTTGEIRATNEVTAYYSSDERLKENIVVIDDALGKLKQIRGVMYDWKDSHIQSRGGLDDYFVRKHDTGVIAQDVEKVLPEVVAERPDGTKAVRYEKLAGIMIQAINELALNIVMINMNAKIFFFWISIISLVISLLIGPTYSMD
jgi:hypothetical protein